MKNAAILQCLFLSGTVALWAIEVPSSSDIIVGGDVPRPGAIAFGDVAITLQEVVATTGLDLRPLYIAGNAKDAPCLVRITLTRSGRQTIYDPQNDAKVLQTLKIRPHDVIEIEDSRRYQDKISEKTKHLDAMITLCSTEVGGEIVDLAGLRHKHALGMDSNREKHEEPLEEYIRKEVVRITEEAKGDKVTKLLELRRGALLLDGLGPGHPNVRETDQLIKMLSDAAKNIKESNRAPTSD